MKSVADLIGAPLLWHEAVAVVQEVASHLSPDAGIPADGELLFNANGTITVGVGRVARLSVVTGLARLLQRLLPDDAPIALRALASENAGEHPTHPTLDAFTTALAFFERPGRAAHLVGVATRLENYTPPSPTEEELERLRKKVIDGPEEAPAPAPVTKRSIRPAYAAGGTLAVVAVIAGVRLPVADLLAALPRVSFTAVSGSPSTAVPTTASSPADSPEAPPEETKRNSGLADSTPPHRLAADRRRSSSHRSPDTGTPVVAPVGAPRAAASSQTDVVDAIRTDAPQVPPVAAPPVGDRESIPHASAPKGYSSEDARVIPAEFVRPQLPSEPEPGPTTGSFDLTVDESGSVIRVRLISPVGRYQERSLVAAAKAWRFRPALLDGRPVKYRMRVPINLPGQQ